MVSLGTLAEVEGISTWGWWRLAAREELRGQMLVTVHLVLCLYWEHIEQMTGLELTNFFLQ